MMMDQLLVYTTGAVIVCLIGSQLFRKGFDPFAPIWMFLAAYGQIYVVQAISYRDWAIHARGVELVTQANGRALWALLWFVAVYFSGVGKFVASPLPRPPRHLSPPPVAILAPPLF